MCSSNVSNPTGICGSEPASFKVSFVFGTAASPLARSSLSGNSPGAACAPEFQFPDLPALLAAGGPAALACGFCSTDLLDVETLQNVAHLHVVKIGDSQAAFITGADFADVILEALQGAEFRGIDQRSISQHAHLCVPLHNPIEHVAARDRS